MRAFYERWLWIMKIFFVEESRLSPRADSDACQMHESFLLHGFLSGVNYSFRSGLPIVAHQLFFISMRAGCFNSRLILPLGHPQTTQQIISGCVMTVRQDSHFM